MSEQNLIKEWKQFGDIGAPVALPNFDEPIDMSQPLKVYWVPGCTGCLRMKEYLTRHGVKFESVNALADKEAFDDLARIGVKRVPIAARGKHWVDGQVIRDLDRLAGIKTETQTQLSPAELVKRGSRVLSVAQALVKKIPDQELALMLPSRPRSYRQLGAHIVQIYELYLDLVENGQRLEFKHFLHDAPADVVTSADLVKFAAGIRKRFNTWWSRDGAKTDFPAKADVYYGDVTLHEFLERTVCHSAQHTRQLQVVLRKLNLPLDDQLSDADMVGLPLSENEYDDKIKIS